MRHFACLLVLLTASTAGAGPHENVVKRLQAQQEANNNGIRVVGEKLGRYKQAISKTMLALDQTKPGSGLREAHRAVLARIIDKWRVTREELADLERAAALLRTDLARLESTRFATPRLAKPLRLGQIVGPFGSFRYQGLTIEREALVYAVRKGMNVRAAAAGEIVTQAQHTDGSVIIVVDHGEYSTLYVGVDNSARNPDQVTVERGDILGTAFSTRVEFQLRANYGPAGVPLNPTLLFSP